MIRVVTIKRRLTDNTYDTTRHDDAYDCLSDAINDAHELERTHELDGLINNAPTEVYSYIDEYGHKQYIGIDIED